MESLHLHRELQDSGALILPSERVLWDYNGASLNWKFFRLHFQLVGEVDCDVHKIPNVFAPSRSIFFFPDSPHLMKTACNCFYSSGFGSHTQLMCYDGQYLVFQHIADLFHSYQRFAFHALPKLTLDHILH